MDSLLDILDSLFLVCFIFHISQILSNYLIENTEVKYFHFLFSNLLFLYLSAFNPFLFSQVTTVFTPQARIEMGVILNFI